MTGIKNICLSNLVATPTVFYTLYLIPCMQIGVRHPISPLLRHGGSADVHLYDRTTKSAGLSFYDPNMIPREDEDEHDLNAAFMNSCPTLVFEIALSQDARRLGSDCARWIGASKGAVKMAIATSIQNSSADDDIMETIKLSVWTLREFIENDETTEKAAMWVSQENRWA